jgi:hypothetical protein
MVMEPRGDNTVFKTICNKACLACGLWQNDPKHIGRIICDVETYKNRSGSSGKNGCATQQISVSDAGAFLL